MKVALLILTTSNKRQNWVDIKDSYLYNMTLKTFLLTYDKEHEYKFYIGVDSNDRIFDNKEQKEIIIRFSQVFKNVEFEFISYNNDEIPKGYCTMMWNVLFKKAYDEGYDYFYQCGDDIVFKTKGWVNACILKLINNNNIGLTGPLNNNNNILTQSFVSRTHMEIFGRYFPEEIKNWCCDDWYNLVYSPNYLYKLTNHMASNDGGDPRYDINNDVCFDNTRLSILREKTKKLAIKHRQLIYDYINRFKAINNLTVNG